MNLEEFCEKYQVSISWDGGFYLEDDVSMEEISPKFNTIMDLEEWLQQNLEEVLRKIQERQDVPDEYDRMAA